MKNLSENSLSICQRKSQLKTQKKRKVYKNTFKGKQQDKQKSIHCGELQGESNNQKQPIRLKRDNWTISNKEKATTFTGHYRNVFSLFSAETLKEAE